MTVLRRPPWLITEEATALLRRTHADFGTMPPVARRGRAGVLPTTKLASYDPGQVRMQSEYLRLVSIVEAYLDLVSEELFARKTLDLDPAITVMSDAILERATRNWDERKTCFTRHHGFKLQECSKWSLIDSAIEVRNAIAHGLGNLTRQQIAGNKIRKMQQSKIRVHGSRIIVTAASITNLLNASLDFIGSVDSKLPSAAR